MSTSSNSNAATKAEDNPKRSLRERTVSLWSKTGITWKVYKAMFKGALAPTICIALYQADSFSNLFTNIGYLIAIVSILSVVFRPRATYLQSLLLNLVFVCTTSAIVVLALFSIIKARENNPQPQFRNDETGGLVAANILTSPYNSNSAAVSGAWLFVLIYALATLRAMGKQYMISAIMGSILANVSMVYAPQLANMTIGLAYIRTFLSAFLVGMAIATAVALFVFPASSRDVIFEDTVQCITCIRSALSANVTYIKSLEHVDMFTIRRTETERHRIQRPAEVETVKSTNRALTAIWTKLQADLPFAKREVGIGYLGPDDISQLSRQIRAVTIPLIGLSCLSDMFERAARTRGWDRELSIVDDHEIAQLKAHAIEEWHDLVRLLKDPFQSMADAIDRGLEHVLIRLRLQSSRPSDAERDDIMVPGQDNFLPQFVASMRALHDKRTDLLIGWCKIHGVELSADYFANPAAKNKKLQELMGVQAGSMEARAMRRQLYVLLYMEFLLWSIGRRVEDFIVFVEGFRSSGKLNRKRLVVPGTKRMRKWIKSTFKPGDNQQDEHNIEDNHGIPQIKLGAAYQKRKDPMHLPPANAWERVGDRIRKASSFLRSRQSAFGFRVACATMSIAVISYLQDTQAFYTRERLFWAQIMISIGMQPTASDSVKTSFFRILGTGIFMLVAWINWYIVVGTPAGVVVFYFVFLHIGPFIIIKYPQYTTLGMIGPITVTLIVGYGLQTAKIGEAAAQASGQQYYPVYLLGPIRLATVLGGLFVGWIWTIFPYPVTEHQEQRDSLGRTLFLMAHYYSAMHETVQLRLRGLDTDAAIIKTVKEILEKTRRKLFMKCNALLAGLRLRTAIMKFDVPIGGKFPRNQYADITELLQSMLNFMVLITYSSTTFNDLKNLDEAQESHSEWIKAFRHIVAHTEDTSHTVSTLMSLLASSVSNAQPLPPHLKVPEPFRLSEQLDKLDSDILSVRHVAEPGYSSFAVTQLALKFLHDDLEVLLPAIKNLVGELDFSLDVQEQDNDDEKT